MDLTETLDFDIKEVIKETEKAWQLKLVSGIYWLPKSQCRVVGMRVYVPKWLSESKNISGTA
ncbi:MAG: hypothetical protein IPJ03_16195 [Ignavibacteriales bacterium]|nr:hypothetical protein [Ignavibacteriales bacterium]